MLEEIIFKVLIRLSLIPLFFQLLIVVPIFLVFSYTIFYFKRLSGIRASGSKERYYETSYDPLTKKRMVNAVLLVTFSLIGVYLIIQN